jgi:hypothetical protein
VVVVTWVTREAGCEGEDDVMLVVTWFAGKLL